MTRPSKSRAIAIANPHLSRTALAALRKKERRSDEDRERSQRRFDEAVPTARKVGAEYPGGDGWELRPPQAKRTLHHDERIVLNGTVLYRKSPTVGVGRTGPGKGDAVSEEAAIEAAWMARAFDRFATKAGIPRAMVDAIGMQLSGCSVEEIAESMGLTRGQVKGYLERGKAKVRGAVEAAEVEGIGAAIAAMAEAMFAAPKPSEAT